MLAVLMLAFSACAREDPTVASPGPPTPAPASPQELRGASCEEQTGGTGANLPDFVEVEVESTDEVDRITFRFEPRDPGVDQPAWYVVKPTDRLHTDPEGEDAELEGQSFVLVVFGAFGVDLSEGEPREIYTGPTELRPRLGVVQEVEQLGDFEATVSWGVGLARPACLRVDAGPRHLTLEFPSS